MKGTFLVFSCVVVMLLAGVAYDRFSAPRFVPVPQQKAASPVVDDNVITETVPDFTVKTVKGDDVRMADLRGKPLLIHFWATWCAPCVAEFPALIDLIDRYDGKVALVALSGDTKEEVVTRFLTALDPVTQAKLEKNPVYIAVDKDRAVAYEMFYSIKYPETVFVDENGKMTHKIVGVFNESGEDVDQLMQGLLHGATPRQ